MATYYPTSKSHQSDVGSYQESYCPPADIMYQNQSTDTSFLELLSGNMQPNTQICNGLDDEQKLNYQELSLSLGMQLPSSSMDLNGFQFNYLNSHIPSSSGHGSQTNKAFNLIGTLKNEAVNGGQAQYLISDTYDGGSFGVVGRILDPKYLKPSQELLDEVVNLRDALSQLKMIRHDNPHKPCVDEKDSIFTPRESTTSCSSGELSASEKQDLQKKVTKLLSLLDEVDKKYREYYQQLRIVETALDVVSGSGFARPYTALARRTISHHFRCLRDAVNGQIQSIRQRLGEQQDDSSERVLPRLKIVEKQLRQQRNLHHLGGTRHSWRPQRGLPEGSVSVLCAWLFEHFLNPYPKDSEKLMLAKKTGLTWSQIANWFINARVRLWKPMIEDIYKEEFCDAEGNCISSQEHASSEDKELPMIGESSDQIASF
ncbi:BEL1-like homeodomain protein 3 [Bidens hawaiensis]|uniref:BEL1-like homeodomain protein 3 n=1 Tax=Bidens hawaiensis TaxID=980011 RepID=UPI00404AB35A